MSEVNTIMETCFGTVQANTQFMDADARCKKIHTFLQNNLLCDVVLIAGDDCRRIPAHRLVLAAANDYFLAIFTEPLKEEDLLIRHVDGATLQLLVHFCYQGCLDLDAEDEDSVKKLLTAAYMLQFHNVFYNCSKYLLCQLNESNCFDIAEYAELRNYDILLSGSKKYILTNFMTLSKNNGFLQLTANNLKIWLCNDDLNVSSEEDVFYSLQSWLEHDRDVRFKHFDELLPLVRLSQLTTSFISDKVIPHCVTSKSQCMVMEAIKWHLMPSCRNQQDVDITMPRKSYAENIKELLAITFCIESGTLRSYAYSPCQNSWTEKKSLALDGWYNRYVMLNPDEIVFVGGGCDGIADNAAKILNIRTMKFRSISSMHYKRRGHALAVLNGLLYAIGGRNSRTVDRWNPDSDSWTVVGPLSEERYCAGAVVLNGMLYLIGGETNQVYSINTVERYDPNSNKWELMASMNFSRNGVGVAVLNDLIYAVGGETSDDLATATAEYYDVITDNWIMIRSLLTPRSWIGCASYGGRLYAVGGLNEETRSVATVEMYDPDTKMWTYVAPILLDSLLYTLVIV